MRLIWAWAILGAYLWFSPLWGQEGVRYLMLDDPQLGSRKMAVWAPKNTSSKDSLQVLVLMDGQMLFDGTTTWNQQEWRVDEIMDSLMLQKAIPPTLVVGLWHAEKQRRAEYFPQKVYEQLSREELVRVQELWQATLESTDQVPLPYSDNFTEWIAQKVLPYVYTQYPTAHRTPQHTFIGGSSMGGLLAWYAHLEHPEIFGGSMSMSTHWPGLYTLENNPLPAAFKNYLEKNLPTTPMGSWYFDTGYQTLDAMYPAWQAQVDEVLAAKGYGPRHWQTRYEPKGAHTEQDWARRLPDALVWLLNAEKPRRYLALGDSYTIGESVSFDQRWTTQLAKGWSAHGTEWTTTTIAKTGWTTDELNQALNEADLALPYDRVSLLIGVNNQYRGRAIEPYRRELNGLIQRAMGYAGGRKDQVFLVSIPDWGVTPFAQSRDKTLIAQQIDQYNEAMYQEASAHGLNWIDITPISRRNSAQSDWIAPDGLHPGPSMYQAWVEKIRETLPQ